MNSHTIRRSRLVALAVVAILVAFAASAGAATRTANISEDRLQPSQAVTSKPTVKSLAKQVKSLKKKVKALTELVAALAEQGLPPSGPAGGDLTGNYPNPAIGNDAVGPGKIPDETLTGFEIAPDSLYANDLASDSVGSAELKGTHVVVSNGVAVASGTTGTAAVACPPGELLTGGGHSWLNDTSSRIVASTPAELSNARTWLVQGVPTGANTLYAWAICLPA